MGNLLHRGYGSSSLAGLCGTHTNYNLNHGADDWVFCSVAKNSKIPFPGISTVECMKRTNRRLDTAQRTESNQSRAAKQAWLTCIWSSGAGTSGYGGTESPSADRSRPQEWQTLCLGNLFPSPGHRTSWHWRLCPRWSPTLRKKGKKNVDL